MAEEESALAPVSSILTLWQSRSSVQLPPADAQAAPLPRAEGNTRRKAGRTSSGSRTIFERIGNDLVGYRPATVPTPGSSSTRTSIPTPSSASRSTRASSQEPAPVSSAAHRNLLNEAPIASSARGLVLTMFDEESARLRPELENKVLRVQRLKEQLKEARKEEQRVSQQQTMNAAQRVARKLKVTCRMQSVIRGWLVRKRVVAALDHRCVQNQENAAKLPDLLRDQLMALQHGVHDLEFRPEDRLAAVVKLQAWWRAIAGRRVMQLVRITRMLQAVTDRMAISATVIQAWFRGTSTKLRLRHIIRLRTKETKQLEWSIMETALKCIIQIQRGFRSNFARRAIRTRRTLAGIAVQAMLVEMPSGSSISVEDSVDGEGYKTLIDSWRPSIAPCAIPAGPGNAGVIIEEPPQHDWELQKIESGGLVPFYDARSQHQVRHQIGGPTAVMMQEQLGIAGSMYAITDGDLLDVNGSIAVGDMTSLQKQLEDSWAIYPNGFTQGFLPGVDKDVWEKGGRAKSYQNSLKLRGVSRRKRKITLDCGPRPCTTVAMAPPSNIEERLQVRESQRKDSIAPPDNACEDSHPMFVNAPAQPALKSAPSWRTSRFIHPDACLGDEDEGSWGFTAPAPPPPTYRSGRHIRGELENSLKDQERQWNSLGVPIDAFLNKKKIGDVDHERVWSIAHALRERLPALTAG